MQKKFAVEPLAMSSESRLPICCCHPEYPQRDSRKAHEHQKFKALCRYLEAISWHMSR
jgi:hypothetical protein